MKDRMLYNKTKSESVRASKIRSITKYLFRERVGTLENKYWEVKGWYNSNEYFYFGCFDTEVEATKFMSDLHNKIAECS